MSLLSELTAQALLTLREVAAAGVGASTLIEIPTRGKRCSLEFAAVTEASVVIELTGYGRNGHRLSEFELDWLSELGFAKPDAAVPNWWLLVDVQSETGLSLEAAVRALVEIFGVNILGLTRAFALSDEVAASSDAVAYDAILEVRGLVPELEHAAFNEHRLWATRLPGHAQLIMTPHLGVVDLEYLGSTGLDDSSDDSPWGLYRSMQNAGASFTMFPNPTAIAARIRRLLKFAENHEETGINPFRASP